MVAKDKKANAHPEAKSLGGGAAGAVEAEQPAATVIASVGQLPVPIRSRCYREHVIVRELLSFASDVACLQEVTPGVHDDFLVPLLRAAGFESTRVRQRPGSLGGELAVVWKTRRLVVEAEAQWTIADLLGREWNADLLVSLEQVPHMLAHVVKQPQQAQVVRFRDLTIGRTVVVVNLHLSAGDSTREHLRALQACLVVREVQRWDESKSPVVVAGDLNCRGPAVPAEAVLTLLSEGAVPPSHHCYVNGRRLGRPITKDDGTTPARMLCPVTPGGVLCRQPLLRNADGTLGSVCFDHGCRGCGVRKPMWKVAQCDACAVDPAAVPPPLPVAVAADVLRCHLHINDPDRPPLNMRNAYEQLTGSCAIYTCDFDPHCDRERKYRKYPWVEMKDHIYLSSGLAAVTVAPGPAISTLGQVPSLTWASDHMSHVVDFRFR